MTCNELQSAILFIYFFFDKMQELAINHFTGIALCSMLLSPIIINMLLMLSKRLLLACQCKKP